MRSVQSTLASKNRIEKWMAFHSVILLGTTTLSLSFGIPYILPLAALISFSRFYWQQANNKNGWSWLAEPANAVTSLRLATMMGILFFFPAFNNITIAVLGLMVLLADGLDGYLARKFQTDSAFGAYLDMETDAFFVLSLCYILFQQNIFGLWVIAPGILRYAYFIVVVFMKPPEVPEARSFRAQLIAVILMGSLIGCFVLPPQVYRPAFWMATLLVFYSFGSSFWQVVKQS